jgi:hypothetical protein
VIRARDRAGASVESKDLGSLLFLFGDPKQVGCRSWARI